MAHSGEGCGAGCGFKSGFKKHRARGRRLVVFGAVVCRGHHHPRYLSHAQLELVREAGETSEDWTAYGLRARRRAVTGDDQSPDVPGLGPPVVVRAPGPTGTPAIRDARATVAFSCEAGLGPPEARADVIFAEATNGGAVSGADAFMPPALLAASSDGEQGARAFVHWRIACPRDADLVASAAIDHRR